MKENKVFLVWPEQLNGRKHLTKFYIDYISCFAPDSNLNIILKDISIEGKVFELRPTGETDGGTYILHANNTDIEVRSTILPELNKTYKITVFVEKGINGNSVSFKEISRVRRNIWKNVGYVLAGVGIVLVAAMVFGGSGSIGTKN